MTSNALAAGDDRAPSPDTDDLLAALVRVSPDLIAVIDPSGALKYASPASEAMLGYGTGELIGASAFDLVHPVDEQKRVAMREDPLDRADVEHAPTSSRLAPGP